MKFTIIGAYASHNRAIGYKNRLPWSTNKVDMIYFRTTTSYCPDPGSMNAIIMGRNTFESLGRKPLPNRVNIVLTSSPESYRKESNLYPELIFGNSSLTETLEMLDTIPYIHCCYVIGGESLYKQAIIHPNCERLLVNEIKISNQLTDNADAWFPNIPTDNYQLVNMNRLSDTVTNYDYIRIISG